ncbi:pre-mRNA 3'-end-processing factor FIP1-like isoform X4 [Myxocyprinus asiaticus]|uniref:pre-mRNA 3'-end-processing factor FIP1-like isoform X4 n=1 Tax=Myxocyprinus asiaticus TaxID=70543 RepID=UPI0022214D88|nr:pre-mRNA 3'-end-processing factor FIP1-like isoform X4 [Myxocyprinus asiaticus]
MLRWIISSLFWTLLICIEWTNRTEIFFKKSSSVRQQKKESHVHLGWHKEEGESKDTEEEEAKLTAAISAPPAHPVTEEAPATENEEDSQLTSKTNDEAPGDDEDSESDSDDDDDDVRVTIGDIKTGAPQYTAYGGTPVNLNIKTAGSRPYGAGTKVKGVDLEAPGSINGVPVLEVDMESFEEKPWRKPGADLSDYFNYGFNEDTWKAYCEKQKRLRMGLDILNIGSTASKISVQQGRTGNGEKEITLPSLASKTDFSSSSTLYKTGLNPVRQASGTIDVIGGQTATISRVEGRRRHNLEGNNIQVISEHSSSEAEPAVAKMPPPFFPPGPLPPNIPPPPFLPPPVSQAPPLIPPPRMPIPVPPPNFPPPTGGPPPSLIPTMDISGHPGAYDGRPVGPYPFPTGGFPPPIQGAMNPWPGMMDNSKQWDYYPRRDKERDKERDRDRQRERGHERDHSPSSVAYNRALEFDRLVLNVMKSDIVTVTMETEGTRGIGSGRAVRRSITERGDIERRKRGDTSHHGAVADGDMTARRVTVIGATNTRSPRGVKRARSPARSVLLTRRTKRPWSNSCPSYLLYFLLIVRALFINQIMLNETINL